MKLDLEDFKMKFELQEQVLIKENGAIGTVIDSRFENEWLYAVLYIFDEQVYIDDFYENKLEKRGKEE